MFATTVLSHKVPTVPQKDMVLMRLVFENTVNQGVEASPVLKERFGTGLLALSRTSPMAQYNEPTIETCWQIILLIGVNFGFGTKGTNAEIEALLKRVEASTYVPAHIE